MHHFAQMVLNQSKTIVKKILCNLVNNIVISKLQKISRKITLENQSVIESPWKITPLSIKLASPFYKWTQETFS